MHFNKAKYAFIRKALSLLCAFAIFWVSLGSIINFHSHHIFGKTLITEALLYKRDEDTHQSGGQDIDFHPDIINQVVELVVAASLTEGVTLLFTDPPVHLVSGEFNAEGLRAPPVCA